MKFRYLILLLTVICLLTVPVFADTDIVEPTSQLYVADYADILSPETERQIVEQVTALKAACGGEIAVVTIDFLNDLDSEEYAYEVLNQWGVGDKKENNGMVLLLVPGEGKGWITVGTGLERYVSAGTLDSIMNNWLWDDFDAGRYDRAVTNTVSQLLGQYESYYGISIAGAMNEQVYYSNPFRRNGEFLYNLLRFILIIIVLSTIFGGNNRRRGGRVSFFPWLWLGHHHHHHRPPHDPWSHRGPRGPGGFGGGFGGGSRGGFGGGGGRGGGAGRR